MSVGRQLCETAIETAADLRRYAEMMGDFDTVEARALVYSSLELARKLEGLVTPILTFEGELRPALVAAQLAKDPL